ncbi:MAG: hypothetical protein AAB263_16560 [Planctomycetota bacterium]
MRHLSLLLPLIATTTASAVELGPPQAFQDLRYEVGFATAVRTASAGSLYSTEKSAMGMHVGVQWVRGRCGENFGNAWAIGLAYDDHAGTIASQTGVQPGIGGSGSVHAQTYTLSISPRFLMRPSRSDPFEWGPGNFQIEIGPFVGIGLGQARIGTATTSELGMAKSWGGRLDLVWASESGWIGGAYGGWEGFSVESGWADSGSGRIFGSGPFGGLTLGRRF